MTPTEVVETYFNNIASGDRNANFALLAEDYNMRFISSDLPPGPLSRPKFTGLKVSSANPIPAQGKNFAEVQVSTQYTTEDKQAIGYSDGTLVTYFLKEDKTIM